MENILETVCLGNVLLAINFKWLIEDSRLGDDLNICILLFVSIVS